MTVQKRNEVTAQKRNLRGNRNKDGDLISIDSLETFAQTAAPEDLNTTSNKVATTMKRVTELDTVLSNLSAEYDEYKKAQAKEGIKADKWTSPMNKLAAEALSEQDTLLNNLISELEDKGLEVPEALMDKYKYLNIY